jgi:hypothetical protein
MDFPTKPSGNYSLFYFSSNSPVHGQNNTNFAKEKILGYEFNTVHLISIYHPQIGGNFAACPGGPTNYGCIG